MTARKPRDQLLKHPRYEPYTGPKVNVRGAAAAPEAMARQIAKTKKMYAGMSEIPTAEIAERWNPNKPLTVKQRAFAKFWAQGESIGNAMHKAGFAPGSNALGWKLARIPQVLALYEEEKRLYEEASQMTRKRVMDGLLEAIDHAKLINEPGSMVSGWKVVAQMCGYLEPVKRRVELNVTGNITYQDMNKLSDVELLKMIEMKATQQLEAIEMVEETDE